MSAAPRGQNSRTSAANPKPVHAPQPTVKSPQARGRMARSKGQSGELEVVKILRDLTGHDVRRKVRQHAGDGDLEGLPFWSVEIKRHATVTPFKLWEWWGQAVDQARASKSLPVLIYRGDRAEWRCVWNADLHASPMPQPLCSDYEATLTAAPETWWALCRDMTNRRP